MIRATELRIGNKFKGIAGIQTVLSIIDNTERGTIEYKSEQHKSGYSHLILCEENRNQYKPIEIEGVPLTEEWLLKFGFNRVSNAFTLTYEDINRTFVFETIITHDNRILSILLNRSDTTIRYVHQLQNLYFALTGEELTTK